MEKGSLKTIALEPEPRRRRGADLPPHRPRHLQVQLARFWEARLAKPPEGLGLAGQVLAGYQKELFGRTMPKPKSLIFAEPTHLHPCPGKTNGAKYKGASSLELGCKYMLYP